MEWSDFLGKALDTGSQYLSNQQAQRYDVQKLTLQAKAADGTAYLEGQRSMMAQSAISPTVLLLGAGLLVAVLVLKD